MPSLSAVTTFVNLSALAASLWLGFYVITRSPYSARSRLAALMLWSLDPYFASNALATNLPSTPFIAWMQQLVILVLPFTLHLSVQLLPEQPRWLRFTRLDAINRLCVPLAYAVAVILILFGAMPSSPSVSLFYPGGKFDTDPGAWGLVSNSPGPFFPLFVIAIILVGLLTLVNLWNGRARTRGSERSQPFTMLFIAVGLATLAGVYLGTGTWMGVPVPTFPGDALVGVGVLLVGYTVARHAALLEGRPMERDFQYSIIVVGSLTAFYLLIVTGLYVGGQVSFLTLVLTIVGTIAANSLFDGVRIALDRVFYRGELQKLRGNLRALAREAGAGGALQERLKAILSTLCRLYRIRKGFITLRHDDEWIVEATHDADPVGHTFAAPVLESSESVGLLRADSKGLAGMVLLIPLWAGGRQIGAVVLGRRESGEAYGDEHLELLEDLGDEIIALVHAIRLQQENASKIDAMVEDFRERERALQMQVQHLVAKPTEPAVPPSPGVGEEDLARWVEDGLRRLYDFPYLGEHPLAQFLARSLRCEGQPDSSETFIDRGKAVNQILLQALRKLRPEGAEPARTQVPAREWHYFVILNDSYVLGEPTRNIMSRLYISEGTFNRTRRRALKSVAKALWEMEQKA